MPFETLVAETQAFMRALDQNNNREYWLEHKGEYDSALKSPALALLDVVSADLARVYGTQFSTKLFRPNRDVRFSKDKTPYQTHLHMMWRIDGDTDGPGWFLGIDMDAVRCGWGWFGFTPEQLTQWRAFAADGGVGELRGLTGMAPSRDPELKRVPAPYGKDHPEGEALRRKSYGLWAGIPGDDLVGECMGHFSSVRPAWERLTEIL